MSLWSRFLEPWADCRPDGYVDFGLHLLMEYEHGSTSTWNHEMCTLCMLSLAYTARRLFGPYVRGEHGYEIWDMYCMCIILVPMGAQGVLPSVRPVGVCISMKSRNWRLLSVHRNLEMFGATKVGYFI